MGAQGHEGVAGHTRLAGSADLYKVGGRGELRGGGEGGGQGRKGCYLSQKWWDEQTLTRWGVDERLCFWGRGLVKSHGGF